MSSLNLTHQFSSSSIAWVEKAIGRWTRGRVKYQASYWPAELVPLIVNITLQPNEVVQVCGRRSIVLLVAPLGKNAYSRLADNLLLPPDL